MKNLGEILEKAEKKALSGAGMSLKQGQEFCAIPQGRIFEILPHSDRVRRHFKGMEVNLCAIVNAKSGLCKEDCAFCSQSVRYDTGVQTYPMIGPHGIVESAMNAEGSGAREFSIVASGTGIEKERDISTLSSALKSMKEKSSLERCASLGILGRASMKRLKEAGLQSYHHNLETSRGFFPRVCSTHEYEKDVQTVKTAKRLGFYTCSGGIFGLGESWEDRIELALTLRELDVDSVPINFLNPRPGTPLEGAAFLTPLECLKIIALFRFMLPEKDIIICGGREVNLRELQPLIFAAGANGMMVGNYLTTKGRDPEKDLVMLSDLGLKPRGASMRKTFS
ncbi:MAG: biotin synthase BioB [Deltaproteobacteria bacterium]|nr:biotin synthase BioB [Deltaproteobacteria bacterium]